MDNLTDFFAVLGLVYGLALVIVKLTPTPRDDAALEKVSVVLRLLAAVFGLDLRQGLESKPKPPRADLLLVLLAGCLLISGCADALGAAGGGNRPKGGRTSPGQPSSMDPLILDDDAGIQTFLSAGAADGDVLVGLSDGASDGDVNLATVTYATDNVLGYNTTLSGNAVWAQNGAGTAGSNLLAAGFYASADDSATTIPVALTAASGVQLAGGKELIWSSDTSFATTSNDTYFGRTSTGVMYIGSTTATGNGTLVLANLTQIGSTTLDEISDPGDPAANKLGLYAELDGVASKSTFVLNNSDGSEFRLYSSTSGGLLAFDSAGLKVRNEANSSFLPVYSTSVSLNGDSWFTRASAGVFRLGTTTTGTEATLRLTEVDLGGSGILEETSGYVKFTNGSGGVGRCETAGGTAAAPGFSFYGDNDNGLYRVAANELGIAVAGVQAAKFDATGADVAATANGALIGIRSSSELLATTSGATVTTTGLIPAGAVVLGHSLRVTTAVTTSSATNTFDSGDSGDADRYGAAIAGAGGTTADESDYTADPAGTWSASGREIILDAAGAETFTAGAVRVTVFYLLTTAPTN